MASGNSCSVLNLLLYPTIGFLDASLINAGANLVKEGSQNKIWSVGQQNIRLCTQTAETGACAGGNSFLASNHLELVQKLCCGMNMKSTAQLL